MTSCRLIFDVPASGAWNMAVDEVLLARAAETGACYWRIYRWEEPTLSLGYFQDVADRQAHAASRGCTLVRRPSGGGAIVHDREITYSVALPGTHALGKHRQRLYHEIHSAVVALLARRGLEASLSSGQSVDAARQPFLCFQRRAPGDVLVRTVKVAGSAQRRVREAVLQHGSLLVGRSPAAPELEGIGDLASGDWDENRLVRDWLDEVAGRLGFTWEVGKLEDDERRRARALMEGKYGTAGWNLRRGR